MSRRFLSKILPALVIMVSASAMLVANDADAKRMGGGSSMGRQSNNAMQRQATTPPASTPQQNTTNRAAAPAAGAAAGAAATAGARSGMSRFMGPLMGIAAGLGLAALFSHLGMGGAMAEMFGSMLLIALVIFAVIFLVRRFRGAGAQRQQPAFQGAAAGGNDRNPIFQKRADDVAPMARQSDAAIPASAAAAPAVSPAVMAAPPVEQALGEWTIPSDFDTSNFLQNAKAHFVKLQGVWDRGDTNEMRELVTDDLLAELGQQLSQREGVNVTEVVLLNAELLGIETVSDGHLASVRYSGMLREAPGAEAFRFEEIWNLFKSQNGGWLLAGVQQIPVTQ